MIDSICKLCNIDCLTIRKLSYHIRAQHNFTSEQYYRKFYLIEG